MKLDRRAYLLYLAPVIINALILLIFLRLMVLLMDPDPGFRIVNVEYDVNQQVCPGDTVRWTHNLQIYSTGRLPYQWGGALDQNSVDDKADVDVSIYSVERGYNPILGNGANNRISNISWDIGGSRPRSWVLPSDPASRQVLTPGHYLLEWGVSLRSRNASRSVKVPFVIPAGCGS